MLRRDTIHLWKLEIATHTGRWEKTGLSVASRMEGRLGGSEQPL
jgi:hypothetical protein